jgi:hypothetical protein
MIAVHKQNRLTRQILMAALLLSAMVVFSSMSFAGTVVDGCGDNKTITISSSTNWTTLCSRKLTLATTSHCVLTGSAKVHNDVTTDHNEYRFTVDNDINPVTGKKAERVLDVTQGSGADPSDLEITSVNDMRNLAPGTYTFRFLAERFSGAQNIDVNAYTMGVVCSDVQ